MCPGQKKCMHYIGNRVPFGTQTLWWWDEARACWGQVEQHQRDRVGGGGTQCPVWPGCILLDQIRVTNRIKTISISNSEEFGEHKLGVNSLPFRCHLLLLLHWQCVKITPCRQQRSLIHVSDWTDASFSGPLNEPPPLMFARCVRIIHCMWFASKRTKHPVV
jgi:hypothetical protein